jgi:hypothetical protein
MTKYISILITLVATSLFFFPFVFTFFPYANTKMMLGAVGVVILLVNLAKKRLGRLDKDFLIISLFSLGVCLASYLSMTINNTPDDSYLSYIISMWVWVSAAYVVVNMIKKTHKYISVELVCFYLIGVGVAQCIIAVTMDTIPAVKHFVDGFLAGEGFMGKNKSRLYGIGCALDVAGGRFAALLIMISFLLPRMFRRKNYNKYVVSLIFSFFIISIIGNIIGRTAMVGMVLGIAYIAYCLIFKQSYFYGKRNVFTSRISVIAIIVILVAVFLYNTNPHSKSLIRFGFEGFFSLVEKGRWEVHSNEMLKHGYIFPDTLKGWIIGDGYIGSTYNDPYYTGIDYIGFYKGTDVGYSRFIFYFGIIGLAAFALFLIKVCQVLMRRFPQYRLMFFGILLLNFIVWLKVSTDLFLVFAPFLCIGQSEEEEYESHIEKDIDELISET